MSSCYVLGGGDIVMMNGLCAGEIVTNDGLLFEHPWTLWQVVNGMGNKKGCFCAKTEIRSL